MVPAQSPIHVAAFAPGMRALSITIGWKASVTDPPPIA